MPMVRSVCCMRVVAAICAALFSSANVSADAVFDKLFAAGKYGEALDHADKNMAAMDRDALVWAKIGQANAAMGLHEKALACYLVSWRMNPGDYNALLGAARAYNDMEQPENAMEMARKALAVNYTAEASWEFARACIALGRAGDAKKAMEKVIQSDSSNAVAARELAAIYFKEGSWSSAIPLLKRGFRKEGSGEIAFQIGKAYGELGVADSAIVFLREALGRGGPKPASGIMLARAFSVKKKYGECVDAYRSVPEDSLAPKDFYLYGYAVEKTAGSDASGKYYEKAVRGFDPSDKTVEALMAKYRTARAFVNDKAYGDAVALLKELIAADPDGKAVSGVFFLISEAYRGLGDTKNAIVSLEKAIAVNSRDIEAYARLADMYQGTGDGEKARRILEAAISLSPDDPKTYLALGRYNLKSGRYEEALRQFEKSDKLGKSGAAAKEGISQAAFGLKRYDVARSAAESALKADGNALEARRVLAAVHVKSGNFKAAQEQYEKLIKVEPENIDLLLSLAGCYEKNGLADKLSVVDASISRLSATDVTSRMRLAKYHETKKSFGEAVRYYREVLAIAPQSADAMRRVASLLRKEGSLSDAADYLKRYIAVKPDDAVAHRDLGDIFYEEKSFDEALVEYRTALRLDPGLKGFHERYAEIVIAKGEQAEVIKVLGAMVKSGTADFGTYLTLGRIYERGKNHIDAIEMYQKALELVPSDADVLSSLASSQAATGDVEGAIVSYEQAIMVNPGSYKELRELGDLYSKSLRNDEAYTAYRKYLERDSSDHLLAGKVGRYLYEKGDYEGAVRYYKMAAGHGNDISDALNMAQACFKTGRGREVSALLLPFKGDKKVKGNAQRDLYRLIACSLEEDSQYAAASIAYGDYVSLPGVFDPDAAFKQAYFLEKGDPVSAQKFYERNIKNYPDDYRSFLRLGLFYSARRDLMAKAVPLFERVSEQADSVPVVWLELGRIYGEMGKEEDELRAYRRYAGIDPHHVEANRRIGSILIRKGQLAEGVVFLEIANTARPDDPDIMSLLAKGYIGSGRSSEAIDLLIKAKERKKDDPEIRFALFEVYRKTGKHAQADKELEGLLEIRRDAHILGLYAEALLMQKKEREAAGVVEEILATEPDNIAVLMLKGKILRALRQYDEAVETYKEIGFIDPNYAPAMLERAETHLEQSKPQWAESFFKRALRTDPSLGRAELGLARIAKIRKDMVLYHEHLENAVRLSPDDDLVREELKKAGKD